MRAGVSGAEHVVGFSGEVATGDCLRERESPVMVLVLGKNRCSPRDVCGSVIEDKLPIEALTRSKHENGHFAI